MAGIPPVRSTAPAGALTWCNDGSARAFAGTLPAGASPTAIEAHRADGSVALQAVDLAEDVAALARGDIGGAGFSAEPLG